MKKVLLVSMPWGALERPALGLSLLKARLQGDGIACDVRYLTYALAEYIGYELYHWICYQLPYTAFAGDWAFTNSLYGNRAALDAEYEQSVLRETWRLPASDIARLHHVRTFIPPFLDYCLASIRWSDYSVVGFTSTFEQNIASLALAKRIKAAHPHLRIVFGGANCEGEMGEELHRQFPFVDYVCSGEAEETLPALARHVVDNGSNANAIKGIVFRTPSGATVSTGAPDRVRDLDSLPYPDFSDYFRDLETSTVAAAVTPMLLFESSRGCWWGAKSHCTFCGLNGQSMAFRSKTPQRAMQELTSLTERWRVEQVEAVDNILDMKYFSSLLPALAQARLPLQLFYEVKANLTRAQVALLRDAGVRRIQPGIESLSDHVLALMRKGTTALRNVQLLKWAEEYGVTVEWNILYGFPGETPEDYARMLEMLPAIHFLRPPCATGPIRLDRFSPYHTAPADFGLTNVRPMAVYRYLYPFGTDSLQRLSYYFDFDYDAARNPTGIANEVIAFVAAWQKANERGTLRLVVRADRSLTLIDTRPGRVLDQLQLFSLEAAAYDFCDELHSIGGIERYLRERFPDVRFTSSRLRAFLDSLVRHRLMVTDGEHYLSLALRSSTLPTQPPQESDNIDHEAQLTQIDLSSGSPAAVERRNARVHYNS